MKKLISFSSFSPGHIWAEEGELVSGESAEERVTGETVNTEGDLFWFELFWEHLHILNDHVDHLGGQFTTIDGLEPISPLGIVFLVFFELLSESASHLFDKKSYRILLLIKLIIQIIY